MDDRHKYYCLHCSVVQCNCDKNQNKKIIFIFFFSQLLWILNIELNCDVYLQLILSFACFAAASAGLLSAPYAPYSSYGSYAPYSPYAVGHAYAAGKTFILN